MSKSGNFLFETNILLYFQLTSVHVPDLVCALDDKLGTVEVSRPISVETFLLVETAIVESSFPALCETREKEEDENGQHC